MILEAGLISFSTWLGSKIIDKGFDSIYETLTTEPKIDLTFRESIEFVANKLEKKYPDILGNSINYFFTQDEVFDELCKLLFVNQNVNPEIISQSFDVSTLPKDFILEFILELKEKLSNELIFQELIANKEIFISVKGISKDISEISLTSNLTLTEIKDIKSLLENRFKDKFNIESFLNLYLKNIITNHGTVNFIGLGIDPSIKKGKRKELDSIFVKPQFQLKSKFHIDDELKCQVIYHDEVNPFSNEKIISYSHLFDRTYNYVILGNPGAGKSLLIKSIMLNIAKKNKIFNNDKIDTFIPFRIELKNYLAFKKIKGGNILKYLAYILEEEYSVPSVIEENLTFLFHKEKVIMFFDGLDEIFDVNDKLNIKNDIENFHNLFSKIRSITTSRFIGYNETKLNDKIFCELTIESFDQEQIKEYVSKWYSLEEEDEGIREAEILDFISKMVNVDNELLSNPLLLSLIVILFRNNLKIPDSKLDIYQSCANTLVDKWDASKNLNINLNETILQKKEPIFSDLAFWQYEILSSHDTEVTYYKAKQRIAESLIKKKLADEDNCEKLAEDFLEYAQKRSLYFENNFTHKTFLEYYTAFWIFSNIELKHNIAERNYLIKKYISNPFWYIVLELLLNMIDKNLPDNELLDTLFKDNLHNSDSLPFLIYVLTSIKNLSIDVMELIYKKAILLLISAPSFNNYSIDNPNDLFNRIQKNFIVPFQNKIISKVINGIEIQYRDLAFYAFIYEICFFPLSDQNNAEFFEFQKTSHYQKTIKENAYLFQLDIYSRGSILDHTQYFENVMEYINLFGPKELFSNHKSIFDSYSLVPFIHFYLSYQLKSDNISLFSTRLNILKQNSVSYIHIIEFALNSHLLPNPDSKSVQYLCTDFETIVDEQVKVLYILILRHYFFKESHDLFKKETDLKTFVIPPLLKNLLILIIKTDAKIRILKIITHELNIQDNEVLKLLSPKDFKETH